jgi:hypothetical protein
VKSTFRQPYENTAFSKNGITRMYGGKTPKILVLGDSHAPMWASVIDSVCREQRVSVSFFAASANSPFLKLPLSPQSKGTRGFTAQQKRDYDLRRLECIKQWKPLVILCARWSGHTRMDEIRSLLKYIGDCGAQVILVEQPPEIAVGGRNTAQYLSFLGYTPNSGEQLFPQTHSEDVARGRARVRQIAKEFPFCRLLETYDNYAPDSKNAYVVKNSEVLYVDDNHLSNAGAFLVRPRFDEAVRAMLRNS